MIFITSRQRTDMIQKTLPKWMAVDAHKCGGLFVVVEPKERVKYKPIVEDLTNGKGELLVLPKNNQGLSYARNAAFLKSWRMGKSSFMVTDDDLYPKDDPMVLLRSARPAGVLGIGAMVSIYMLLLGVKPDTGLYYTNGSLGFGGCFALNTRNMKKLGGWDNFFIGPGQADRGIAIRGMHELGLLWRMNSHFQIDHLNQIGSPGGQDSFFQHKKKDRDHYHHEWHKYLYKKYPEYISDPKKCVGKRRNTQPKSQPGQFKIRYKKCTMRYSWKRMCRDWCGVDFTKVMKIK